MKITPTAFWSTDGYCRPIQRHIAHLWPNGVKPTLDNLVELDSFGLNVRELTQLLPPEGINIQRHFALECATRVVYLNKSPLLADGLARVTRCVLGAPVEELSIARRYVYAAYIDASCKSDTLLDRAELDEQITPEEVYKAQAAVIAAEAVHKTTDVDGRYSRYGAPQAAIEAVGKRMAVSAVAKATARQVEYMAQITILSEMLLAWP